MTHYQPNIVLALQRETLRPQRIAAAQRVIYALVLVCLHVRLLIESLPLATGLIVRRQRAGLGFGIVADSVSETQDGLRGVLTFAWSEEKTDRQVNANGTDIGHCAGWVGVSINKDFVLAC